MKKTLALILGVIMLMGCLSVSAAASDLAVSESSLRTIIEEDFSDANVNSDFIVVGAASSNATIADGVIKAAPTVASDPVLTIRPGGKSSVPVATYYEFTINHDNLFDSANYQLQMPIVASDGASWIDFRYYGGENPFFSVEGSDWIKYYYKKYTVDVKIKIDPVKKTYAIWIDGDEFIAEGTNNIIRGGGFTDVDYIALRTNFAIDSLIIDNVKVYVDDAALSEQGKPAYPVCGEVLAHEDFNAVGADNPNVVLGNGYKSWANGAVTVDNGYVQTYFFDDQHITLGEYAVEATISATTANNGYHDIYFGDNFVFHWNGAVADKIWVRAKDQSSFADVWTDTAGAVNFNAKKYLKITCLFNTQTNVINFWLNGKYAGNYTFQNTSAGNQPRFVWINPNGSATLSDIVLYRPLSYDETTGLNVAETEDTVKIATNAAKAGNLYFAQYAGTEAAKNLSALGSASLNLAPGKVYTVSKADWAGAKAFFWDADMKPIVDSWTLN